MGLFNFGKKKNAQIKNPNEFYTDCVEAFHTALGANGYAKKGLIFIPELIPLGNKAVLAFLKDPFFQMEAGGNATQYYYLISSLCFMTGVAYAEKWHTNYNELKTSFADQIIEEGPPEYAQPLLEAELGLDAEMQSKELFATIFDQWIEMHKPYWNLTDPREYTFKAMLASYQAGISTILEKYGY